MSTEGAKPSILFWVVGALLLVWGLIGIAMYCLEVTMSNEAYLENFGAEMLAVRDLVPAWSIGGYAIGVWFGLAGTISLLLRRRLAIPLYIISILGALLGWSWYVFSEIGRSVMAPGSWGMVTLVIALCIFSIWWARRQKSQGVLR